MELAVELPPGFFFLILMPGTGAEFKASRNPVHSIAAVRRHEMYVRCTAQQLHNQLQLQFCVELTLSWNDFDFDFFGRVGRGI